MDKSKLEAIANQMITSDKGILAMDDSTGTNTKHFNRVGIEPSVENRRKYRQLLVTTPELSKYISGVIMFDETLRQKTDDGMTFAEVLESQGILPGIKADMKAHDLPFFPGEKMTEGLDGLRGRLKEYAELGVKFAKWRSVIVIQNGTASDAAIDENAHGQARYASLCQEAGIVPIVEPEVMIDGDHSIEDCYDVTARTLKSFFAELKKYKVHIPGIVLKPSMVISGKDNENRANTKEIAEMTSKVLKECLPDDLPGIAFLSGGQGPEEATTNLDAINKLGEHPWRITFSYGRALKQYALETWAETKDIDKAQDALSKRAKLNSVASMGKYSMDLE